MRFYLKRDILIRQGSYHSALCGDRFIKVSTTVPSAWIDAFCSRMEEAVDWSRNAPPGQALY